MNISKSDDFFNVVNVLYKTLGYQPYEKSKKVSKSSFWTNFIFYIGFMNMNMVLLGEIIYSIGAFTDGKRFVEGVATLSYIGFVSIATFKVFTIYWNKNLLNNCIKQLEDIFPNEPEAQEEYKVSNYLRKSNLVCAIFIFLYMLCIWTYNLFTTIQYFIYEVWLKERIVGQSLPYYMYIPWKWRDNWSFYLLLFSQCLAGHTSAAGQIASDLLLCGIINQVIMHYDYLNRKIEQYAIRCKNGDLNSEDSKKDEKFLKDVIVYHNNILSLSGMLNEAFGLPLLFNFLSSTGVMCFVGFQFFIGANWDEMFKAIVGVLTTSSQVYMICYYGQLLIDSSVRVSESVYNQDWSNANLSYKKMLILIAKRAQKPAYLQATSLVQVSHDTMADIMQMAYKVLAVLRTMYSN